MLKRNPQYYEWLLPYLEGGLDEARRALLEARLAADPALAAEAERLRRTSGGLRAAASRTPPPENAQVPDDLWPHLRARLVLDPTPRPRARLWWAAGVGAPAAAALIVAAFWLPGWHTPEMALPSHKSAGPAKVVLPLSVPPPAPSSAGAAYPTPSAKRSVAKPVLAASRPAPVAPKTNPFTLPAPVPVVPPRSVHATFGSAGLSNGPAPGISPVTQAPRRATSSAPPMPPPPAQAVKIVPPPAAAPKPVLPAPQPTSVAVMGADEAAPVTRAAPNVTVNGLEGAARPQAKPPALNSMEMHAPSVQALRAPRRSKAGLRYMAPPTGGAAQAFTVDGAVSLDAEQAALSAAVQSPLWGENAGDQQANQALMAARESGLLDDLRARLEARRGQSPQSLVTGRMLAAVYAFGFSPEPALRERRRVVGLEGATGEDWFALAQAEEAARNTAAARAAYRHALEAPSPPSAFHAAIARGK